MFTGRSARTVATMFSAVALNFCLAFVGLASAGQNQESSDDVFTSESDETPEEIIVYGKTDIIVLRNALYRAEEGFFDLFNSLNSNDEFDVKCEKNQTAMQRRRRTTLGGMMGRRCSPSFALEYEAWATAQFIRGGMLDASFANLEHQMQVRIKQREMEAEMARLIEANPEFLDKIGVLESAKDALDAEKERRGPCPKIFCRE